MCSLEDRNLFLKLLFFNSGTYGREHGKFDPRPLLLWFTVVYFYSNLNIYNETIFYISPFIFITIFSACLDFGIYCKHERKAYKKTEKLILSHQWNTLVSD